MKGIEWIAGKEGVCALDQAASLFFAKDIDHDGKEEQHEI